MSKPEIAILVILRIIGVGALFALPAVFLPYDWMNAIHGAVGLGMLPEAPIVDYLAHSLSAFYFLLGVVTLYISRDIRCYRDLVTLWAVLGGASGILLIGIDVAAGMPASWTLSEGPPAIATALLVLWLQRISPSPPSP